MKRTLFIGDVHGCADELERIVDAFGYVPGKDTLYQTGDIINKGPLMLKAIDFVVKNGILCVRGNHEEHLLRALNPPECEWSEKQRNRFSRLSMEEWHYIAGIVKNWPLWYDTPHALLVHAGIQPGVNKLEDMDPTVILSIRKWNDHPWYKQVTWPKTIVFGHWAKKGFVCKPGFIGLDTGCVYGKELTAWCPEEDKFYRVPAARVYSPVKDKTKTAQEAPCIVAGDVPPKGESSVSNSKNAEVIREASPSIAAEWAGYT